MLLETISGAPSNREPIYAESVARIRANLGKPAIVGEIDPQQPPIMPPIIQPEQPRARRRVA